MITVKILTTDGNSLEYDIDKNKADLIHEIEKIIEKGESIKFQDDFGNILLINSRNVISVNILTN